MYKVFLTIYFIVIAIEYIILFRLSHTEVYLSNLSLDLKQFHYCSWDASIIRLKLNKYPIVCDIFEDRTNINLYHKREFLLNVTNEENIEWITMSRISEYVIWNCSIVEVRSILVYILWFRLTLYMDIFNMNKSNNDVRNVLF